MANEEIAQKVIKTVAEALSTEESNVTLDSKFVDDLGADSLDLVELMMALEANFDCDIPDEEASKISTVKDAVNYIERMQNSGS